MKYRSLEETPHIHSADELRATIELLEQMRAHLV
jgi:hypothetical protein